MTSSLSASPRLVLRSTSSTWVLVAFLVVSVLLLLQSVVYGRIDVVVRWAPWLALVCWLVFALLVRPCLILTADRLEIVNVWSRHRVPWNAIEHIQTRFQFRVILKSGRVLRGWGGPTPGVDRSSIDRAARQHGAGPRTSAGPRTARPVPIDIVFARWASAAETGTESTDTTVEVFVVLVTAILLLACLGTLAL